MTERGEPADELTEAPASDASRPMAARVVDICPYLLSEDGSSRRLGPWRGHRCLAVRPPARLALDKQRRLCLTAAHTTCATFVAARGGVASSTAAFGDPDLERVTRWSITRTTASVVEPGSRIDGLWSRLSGTVAQAVLGGALLVALIAMARGQFIPAADPGASSTALPTASPAAEATPFPSASPSPSLTPSPAVSPSPIHTPPPTATPTTTPQPTGSTIYIVRSGDSLWAIAVRFHTTIKAIQELNGLGSDTTLHIGQRLEIP